MADRTGISWTDATWNPIRGCSRVSEGRRNCYAETMAARFSYEGQPYHGLADRTRKGSKWTGVVRMVPERLADPLRWSKPRRVFVNSMSDLFHESLTNEQIADVFAIMALAPRHTYQVLTKRAKRMREWFALPNIDRQVRGRAWEMLGRVGAGRVKSGMEKYAHDDLPNRPWPLPSVWLGVSVENQAAADERIPELLATPAAVRFLSCEPLLDEVSLRDEWMFGRFIECPDENNGADVDPCRGCPAIPNDGKLGGDYCGARRGARIDWIIAGCESGPGARPCNVEWLRSLRDQCAATSVPFFLKQAVEQYRDPPTDTRAPRPPVEPGIGSKRKAGGVIELPYLDGVQHAAFPETP